MDIQKFSFSKQNIGYLRYIKEKAEVYAAAGTKQIVVTQYGLSNDAFEFLVSGLTEAKLQSLSAISAPFFFIKDLSNFEKNILPMIEEGAINVFDEHKKLKDVSNAVSMLVSTATNDEELLKAAKLVVDEYKNTRSARIDNATLSEVKISYFTTIKQVAEHSHYLAKVLFKLTDNLVERIQALTYEQIMSIPSVTSEIDFFALDGNLSDVETKRFKGILDTLAKSNGDFHHVSGALTRMASRNYSDRVYTNGFAYSGIDEFDDEEIISTLKANKLKDDDILNYKNMRRTRDLIDVVEQIIQYGAIRNNISVYMSSPDFLFSQDPDFKCAFNHDKIAKAFSQKTGRPPSGINWVEDSTENIQHASMFIGFAETIGGLTDESDDSDEGKMIDFYQVDFFQKIIACYEAFIIYTKHQYNQPPHNIARCTDLISAYIDGSGIFVEPCECCGTPSVVLNDSHKTCHPCQYENKMNINRGEKLVLRANEQ